MGARWRLSSLRYFQSHYGAIATRGHGMTRHLCAGLSIPLWCDCNTLKLLWSSFGGALSIPLWCDCNACIARRVSCCCFFQSHYGAIATMGSGNAPQRQDELSIPLWCDCNDKPTTRCAIPLGFQSHYGAIATRGATATKTLSSPFQSHYGAIATAIAPSPSFGERLSIPLWCDCNWSSIHSLTVLNVFQSHYGAIATRSEGNTSQR